MVKWNIWICFDDQYSDYTILVCNRILDCCHIGQMEYFECILRPYILIILFWSAPKYWIADLSMPYWPNKNILNISWWRIFWLCYSGRWQNVILWNQIHYDIRWTPLSIIHSMKMIIFNFFKSSEIFVIVLFANGGWVLLLSICAPCQWKLALTWQMWATCSNTVSDRNINIAADILRGQDRAIS